jgi:hypothetical protein
MGWIWGLVRHYWVFVCLGCMGWFVLHTGLVMIRDVRANRRKMALRRRTLYRFRAQKSG